MAEPTPPSGGSPLDGLSENDVDKVKALLRSFATPDDLLGFIRDARELRRESERRAWAWDVLKKTAAAITLLAGAFTVLWNAYVAWVSTR